MKKIYILFTTLFLFCYSGFAQQTSLTVNLITAGSLEAKLGADKNTVVELKISGPINGDDINTIRSLCVFVPETAPKPLVKLDLYDVTIVGGTTYNDVFNQTYTTIENEISMNMFNLLDLERIVLPKSVVKIGKAGVSQCYRLKEAIIPEGVVELGDNAFSMNTIIEEIDIPSTVTKIGSQCFMSNNKLLKVHCRASTPSLFSIGNNFFPTNTFNNGTLYVPYTKKQKYSIFAIWGAFKNIVEEGPKRPEKLEKAVTISTAGTISSLFTSDEIKNVTDLTINGNLNGTDIKFIMSLENLFVINLRNASIASGGISYTSFFGTDLFTENDIFPANMFYNHIKINEVILPNSIQKIGNHAFYGSTNLSKIDLSINISEIEEYAFTSCVNLENAVFGSSLSAIGQYAFANCEQIKSIIISDNVLEIGKNAFYKCVNLQNASIGRGITTLQSSIFSGCVLLKEVNLTNGITLFESNVFNECASLEKFIIPNSVIQIDNSAFNNCSSLQSVTIGSEIEKIFHGTFSNCSSLSEIICLSNTPAKLYHTNTFTGVNTSICKLYVPIGTYNAYKTAEFWSVFNNNIIEGNITSSIEEQSVNKNNFVFANGGYIYFSADANNVKIIELSGKIIFEKKHINKYESLTLKDGMYIIYSDECTTKIIVR